VKKEDIISSGLLEMYAFGATTAEETAMVHQAFINWPDVKEDVNTMEETMENYALINASKISPEAKDKLFTQLNLTQLPAVSLLEEEKAPVIPIKSYRNIAAACAALLVGSAILNFVFFSKFNNVNKKYAEREDIVNRILKEEEREKAAINIVRSKYSLPLKMKPEIAPKDADAKIYWLTNTGEIYLDPTNLPAAPNGMQYQLWAIVDGKAIDAGLINAVDNPAELHLQKMKTFGKAQAFAVTLEVAGGVYESKEKPFVIVSL
jgi:Anti-sigma-K factor rskA